MVYDRQLLVRRRALRTMLVSGPITVAVAVVAAFGSAWLKGTRLEFLLRGEVLIVLALPAVPFLIALASWLSSRSREELEAAWNGLRGWQRGVLGIAIVLGAAAVILGGVVLALARITAQGR
jgi:type IV secretory pathway VirB2 component (pilin)